MCGVDVRECDEKRSVRRETMQASKAAGFQNVLDQSEENSCQEL